MIQESRQTLYKKLSSQAVPLRVQIELTRRCNLKCVHCMLGGGIEIADEMQPEDHAVLIGQMREAGVFNVSLTGGECFSHPRADEIISLYLDSDLWVSLQTNGTLLTEKRLRMLCSRPRSIRSIAVSLYGATADVHDAVTRTPGSFEKTVSSIKDLVSAGFKVEVITLLMKINHHQHDSIRELCDGLGVKHQFNTVITPGKDEPAQPLAQRLTEDMLRKLPRPWETFMEEFSEVAPSDFAPERSLESWCTMARTTGYIDSRGNLLPCSIVDMPAGSVRERSFADLWRNSDLFNKIRNYRIGQFECSGCRHFPTCRPCPGLGFFEQGDFFAAPKEICRITQVFLGDKEEEGEHETGNTGKKGLHEAGAD